MAKKKSGTVLRYNRWGYIFLIPFVVVFIIFQLIPLISTIYNSFFEHYFKNGLTEEVKIMQHCSHQVICLNI